MILSRFHRKLSNWNLLKNFKKEKLEKANAAENRYKCKRIPSNRFAKEKAQKEYLECYARTKENWLFEKCEELKARDCNVWEKINKIINGNISAPVQPLRIGTSTEYDFDDKKIAERMEDIHIKRSTADYSKFDEEFHKYINEETEKIIKDLETTSSGKWNPENIRKACASNFNDWLNSNVKDKHRKDFDKAFHNTAKRSA